MHKTASTFLQRSYFKSLDCDFLTLKPFRENFSKQLSTQTQLLSSELMSGKPWNKKWLQGKANSHSWLTSYKVSIDTLRKLFPKAHILLFIRKHGNLLVSMYKQYIHEGGVLPLEQFYGDHKVIQKSDLFLEERIHYVKERFENVHILSFEIFRDEGIKYLDNFFNHLNIKRVKKVTMIKYNEGVSGNKLKALRLSNKLYRFIPHKVDVVLRKTGVTPRNILQNHLKFWSVSENNTIKNFKQKINLQYASDWHATLKYIFK
ncbi:MAG: hypothetical protein KDC57_15525 [Saprospiraceae bacterium]|nr:hypothetical protein [Saprospiraceae bacterium]